MNTLTSHMGTGGNNVSMVAKETNVRRLTPIECERLQGFPDDWTASQSDSTRYRQVGNAIAVPVVEWIVEGIRAAD
jgi:DNA (cytosine-5)-methyltransferase 1